MSKIIVHLLEFYNCDLNHSSIVLIEKKEEGNWYYHIDIIKRPKDEAILDEEKCLRCIKRASKSMTFEIEGNMDEIIKSWKIKYKAKGFDIYYNNCSDTTSWFLEEHAGIHNPGSCGKPISCDMLCFGIFAPSFLQCCTLPGRVMAYANKKISDEKTPLTVARMDY